MDNSQYTKKAALSFKRSQLIYDIANYSFIEGEVLDLSQYHSRQVIQDVAQQGKIDRLTRIIDLTVALATEALFPFTKKTIERDKVCLDDTLHEDRIYWIELALPTDFSRTTLILLEKLIHEFIVCRAMAEWMSITNPPKTEPWTLKANAMLDEILKAIKHRSTTFRRKIHPF